MRTDPLFRALDDHNTLVEIEFDGERLEVPNNANLAAALLEAGVTSTRRTPVSGAPRSAYCMMGVCFECLVQIDGVTRQACQVRTQSGLKVETHFSRSTDGESNV